MIDAEICNANHRAATVIHSYIDDCLFPPEGNWPKSFFLERSYSRWAALEILAEVVSKDYIPALTVAKEFLGKVNKALFSDGEKSVQFIFRVARNVAEDIIEILTAMG